jgi:hypothetical protein
MTPKLVTNILIVRSKVRKGPQLVHTNNSDFGCEYPRGKEEGNAQLL